MRRRTIAKLLASTLVVACLSLVAVHLPGPVLAQTGCSTIQATISTQTSDGDSSQRWFDNQSGAAIYFEFFSGSGGSGTYLGGFILDPSEGQWVADMGFPLIGSTSWYTFVAGSHDWRSCLTAPAPTSTPTSTPTNTPSPTELVFPTETVTNTPTSTATPHYEALILEQEQRTFQWLYFALIVLGSLGLLIFLRGRL